jgi:hypothetical protein
LASRQSIPHPVFRPLRVFAVDPGTTARFETAVINETTLQVPWEDLDPGPDDGWWPQDRPWTDCPRIGEENSGSLN